MKNRAIGLVLAVSLTLRLDGVAQQPATAGAVPQAEAARAEEALHSSDTREALARYRALVAAHPQDDQALTSLGVLLYGAQQPAEAADVLRRSLAINGSASRTQVFLALSQAALQQCDVATPTLAQSFAAEPTGKLQRLVGLVLLGCLMQASDASAALPVVTTLRHRYPTDPDVLYESAELYTRLWSDAADALMTEHPESYRVHQLAGEVNEAQGKLEQAIRQYRAALAEDSHLHELHYRIGQLLLRLGAPDADPKAMEEFRAELTIDPESANAAFAMAEIDRHLNRPDAATAEYMSVLKIDPERADARVGLAQVLLAQHQTAAAEAQLRPVLAKHPGDAQAHYAMMLAFRAEGKLPAAAAEMALFQQNRQASDQQFRQKLAALLGGEQQTGAPSEQETPTE